MFVRAGMTRLIGGSGISGRDAGADNVEQAATLDAPNGHREKRRGETSFPRAQNQGERLKSGSRN